MEHARAERIALQSVQAEVLPRMKLAEIAGVLAGAKAIVAVDTGLGHLAAALDVPTVSLYGPTNSTLTGAVGRSQVHLSVNFPCAPCLGKECTYRGNSSFSPPPSPLSPLTPPCFLTIPPSVVWGALETLL